MADPPPAPLPRRSSRRPAASDDPAVLADVVTDKGAQVYFETNSDQLNADGLQAIAALEAKATAAGITHIEVVGHADSRGSAQYNVDLSLRRAQGIADQLRKD